MKTLGIALAAALGFAMPASADTIASFTLDGVTFNDGGTATGGFTLDLTTGALTNINITTSTDGLFGVTYTGGNGIFESTGFSNSPASFTFDFSGFLYEADLQINLVSALTPSDLTSPHTFSIANGSEGAFDIECGLESGFFCGSRTINAGSLDIGVSATPLPAALPLFAGGLGVVGLLARRRKRKRKSPLVAG